MNPTYFDRTIGWFSVCHPESCKGSMKVSCVCGWVDEIKYDTEYSNEFVPDIGVVHNTFGYEHLIHRKPSVAEIKNCINIRVESRMKVVYEETKRHLANDIANITTLYFKQVCE
jgi:hypothetical protein